MSIFVVYMPKWFPKGSERHEIARMIVEEYSECHVCKGPVKWKRAYAYHSMPYGNGSEVWCSKKCLNTKTK